MCSKRFYNTSQSSTQAYSETVLLVSGDYVLRAAMKALNDKVNQPHQIITLLHSQMLSTKQEGLLKSSLATSISNSILCVLQIWRNPIKKKKAAGPIFIVFGMTQPGIEPTTFRLESGCSTSWANPAFIMKVQI